ncbi:site-2 protease family protein [Neptunomonas antarctica]|uniref:Zn-dependent protease (Includes SpoIVFB) n=1 Tax=Neptunomonas antarctica TaxID=619304 RepID=A0A1N7KG94_9GAMM|nr:site-2 protease family protein [Neptunomonas antarctica]SIS60612.1 Zn-dependent protease (includes SpoIVFB) [Neptunomonas antarctica]
MQLLRIECLGRELRLEGSMAGWQALYWDNQLVSQHNASADPSSKPVHQFTLQADQTTLQCQLSIDLTWQPFALQYQLHIDNDLISQSTLNEKDIETQEVRQRPKTPNKLSIIGLGSLALKLFKSAKIIKVLFAAGSLAAYAWLFSFQFAIALILCLVFHEYGHIRAMKYFGLKTKGIYLIPFVGGLALSDDKINTRWQDVVISIMGPFFGLILSCVCLVVYWITDIELFAGLAVFNALLNLFNLLPVLPLDGGHILKSIAFSVNSIVGLVACVLGAALGIFASYYFGLALLGFLLAIGSMEIIFEWKHRHLSQLLPLNRYAQIVSALWYFITIGGLSAIIWMVGQGDNHALALPLKILAS